MHEGVHYRIRHFSIMGNTRFKSDDLLKAIKTQEGQYYNAFQLRKDIAKFKKKYDVLGYTYMNVEIVPRYLEQPGNIDLILRVDEDKPYKIRRITIHIDGDHPRIKRGLAYNYIRIAPGEWADPTAIEKSKKTISGAQVFKTDPTGGPVKIKITRVTDASDAADAAVRGQNGDDVVPSLLGGPRSPKVPVPDMHVVQKAVLAEDPAAAPPADPPAPNPVDAFDPFRQAEPVERWTEDVIIRGQNPEIPFCRAIRFSIPLPKEIPSAR